MNEISVCDIGKYLKDKCHLKTTSQTQLHKMIDLDNGDIELGIQSFDNFINLVIFDYHLLNTFSIIQCIKTNVAVFGINTKK